MLQQDIQNTKTKKSAEEPQFSFNKYEILFFVSLIVVHQIIVTKIIIEYSDVHHDEIKTSPSYLTNLINRNRDSHDIQWETYRSNLPVLGLCVITWYGVSRIIEKYKNEKAWVMGGLMLLYCFRCDLLIHLLLLVGWYKWTEMNFGRKYFVGVSWAICIGLLYLNQFTDHFRALSIAVGNMMPIDWMRSNQRQISCGQVLNMTFLKLLSFALDRHRGNEERELEKHLEKCQECTSDEKCLKGRNMVDTDDFSFKSYINYLFFAPTIFTGPPLGYKNFISFINQPTTKRPEFGRCLFLLACFQIFQHYCPVIPLTSSQSFVEAQIFAYFHIVFIWFKFLLIWRIGRAWAAACGVEVIDNLSRCVCNNYGFEGFWRMWHRGFNQWLVRYLYIPLGGNQNIISVVAVVAFVAFWHDHTLNILVWAFAVVIFILPQILIKRFARRSLRGFYSKHWFKYLCAISSAVYIYFLTFTNIAGFGYGVDKFGLLWERMKHEWKQVLWSLVVVASAVVLMFYQRSREPPGKNF